MRTTSANQFDTAIVNLQRRQEQMSDAQNKLTTGKRVTVASDDPVAAARAERALSSIARSEANQRGLDASRNAMTLSEAALGDAVELLQQARETLVAAGNGSFADTDRRALVNKLREIRGQLLSTANRSDGGGGYLFGGQGSSSAPPFIDKPGGIDFLGQGGETQASSSENLGLTIDGELVWLKSKTGNGVFTTAPQTTNTGSAWITSGSITHPTDIPYPVAPDITPPTYTIVFTRTGTNTTYDVMEDGNALATAVAYSSGKSIAIPGRGIEVTVSGQPATADNFVIQQSTNTLSVFETLDTAMQALSQLGQSSSQAQQAINTGMTKIDNVINNMAAARSAAGESLNRMDSIETRISSLKLSAETTRSQAEDLDMVNAISKFQALNTGYEAALKSYAMVQRMSLFQYITG
jgi:flagellar hook-associated protein 3 FlgL